MKTQPVSKQSRFAILSKGLRRERGQMNATERAYADMLNSCDDVAQWWFEPFTLRLSRPPEGQPARYSPDFLVLMQDGMTYLDDTKAKKGFDDKAAIVRIKCAAEQYTLWTFRTVYRRKRKDGGGWERHEV